MIATKFVICLLASVVVTMGFKLDEGDEGFPRREADEAQEGSPRREADETLEWGATDAGDGGFMSTNEQTDYGSLSREADSVESENAESHNNADESRSADRADIDIQCKAEDPADCCPTCKKVVTEAVCGGKGCESCPMCSAMCDKYCSRQ